MDPGPAASSDAPDGPRTVVDPGVLAERRVRRAERAEAAHARVAAEALRAVEALEARAHDLADRLERAEREREALRSRLSPAGATGGGEDLRERLRAAERHRLLLAQELEAVRRQRADDALPPPFAGAAARGRSQDAAALAERLAAAEAERAAAEGRARRRGDALRAALEALAGVRVRLGEGSARAAASDSALADARARLAALEEDARGHRRAERALGERARAAEDALARERAAREQAESQLDALRPALVQTAAEAATLRAALDRERVRGDRLQAELEGVRGRCERLEEALGEAAEALSVAEGSRRRVERALAEGAPVASAASGSVDSAVPAAEAAGGPVPAAADPGAPDPGALVRRPPSAVSANELPGASGLPALAHHARRLAAPAAGDDPARRRLLADLDRAAAALRARAPAEDAGGDGQPGAAPDGSAPDDAAAPVASERVRPWRRPRRAPGLRAGVARLAGADPEDAARLLLGLLPPTRTPPPGATPARLSLPGLGTHAVLVAPDGAVTRADGSVAPAGELHLEAEPAALAALLAAHGRGLRLPRGVRVRAGGRRARRLLRTAAARPATLADVLAAGARPDPEPVFRLLPHVIAPEWTRGHRFAVVHAFTGPGGGSWRVGVDDGAPLRVERVAEGERGDALVEAPLAALPHLLAGSAPPPALRPALRGDLAAIAAWAAWTARARAES